MRKFANQIVLLFVKKCNKLVSAFDFPVYIEYPVFVLCNKDTAALTADNRFKNIFAFLIQEVNQLAAAADFTTFHARNLAASFDRKKLRSVAEALDKLRKNDLVVKHGVKWIIDTTGTNVVKVRNVLLLVIVSKVVH